jgi:pimeloyl-ACP methyl ester carboxylesterase
VVLAVVVASLLGALAPVTPAAAVQIPREVAREASAKSVGVQRAPVQLQRSAVERATVVARKRCPASRFTCITLRVPRDHFASSGAGAATFDVTFALQRATRGPRQGVFVTITGGPGTSGISVADSYTDALDPRIAARYDIVFLDQRGIGLSEPIQCPDATLDWYTSDALPTVSRAQAEAYAADARRYARRCVTESGIDSGLLPFFSTRQAVEDLEAVRRWLRAPQIDLYGESYGTQYVQTYAAAHPARVHALFVDGPVDLTLTATDYYAEQVRAFDETLQMTTRTCTAVRSCRLDVAGRDPLAVYDRLAKRLQAGPRRFDFVDASGTVRRRSFSLSDLESAAAGYLYENFDQMLLQRAMAWASRGELLPLARLTYIALGQDPESLAAIPDPTYSDAMFYAVECMDYAYGNGSAAERVDHYLDAGRAARVSRVRMGSIFYGDLPCAHWPVHPADESRPPYLTNPPFPVFVLASTEDPATPYAGARRIFNQLDDAYLIVQPAGPHIIFGRGSPCPDDLITAYLLRGARPAHRRTFCDEVGPDPYVRLPAARIGQYTGAMRAMRAMDREINFNADYWSWDGAGRLGVGCLHGGVITYRPYANGYRAALEACAFTRWLPLTGNATINDVAGTFALDVRAPAGTRLRYLNDADAHRSVWGTYRGRPVDIGRKAA